MHNHRAGCGAICGANESIRLPQAIVVCYEGQIADFTRLGPGRVAGGNKVGEWVFLVVHDGDLLAGVLKGYLPLWKGSLEERGKVGLSGFITLGTRDAGAEERREEFAVLDVEIITWAGKGGKGAVGESGQGGNYRG